MPSVLEKIRTGLAGSALRRPLKITFEGEAGVDEGGILSEVGKECVLSVALCVGDL